MRPPFPLLVLLLALAVGVSAAQGGRDAVNKPLLGIAGQPDRFERQTGQDSQVRHIFLGWGQGSGVVLVMLRSMGRAAGRGRRRTT